MKEINWEEVKVKKSEAKNHLIKVGAKMVESGKEAKWEEFVNKHPFLIIQSAVKAMQLIEKGYFEESVKVVSSQQNLNDIPLVMRAMLFLEREKRKKFAKRMKAHLIKMGVPVVEPTKQKQWRKFATSQSLRTVEAIVRGFIVIESSKGDYKRSDLPDLPAVWRAMKFLVP